MIDPLKFINNLKKNNINFFTGVPDSLFSNLCVQFEKKERSNHIVSTNEGSAIGLAIGFHLASGKIPFVYLQNSGLGNIINPIISLADRKVYNIPIFLLIGWRGEVLSNRKQIKDEPQHKTQGFLTEKLLKILNIKYKILDHKSNFIKDVNYLKKFALKKKKIVALLIRKNTFKNINSQNKTKKKVKFSRESALKEVYKYIPTKFAKVSTTGMLSRELYELNKKDKYIKNTFMCVGGMGHAISIATGITLYNNKKIFCLDGDGSSLMHLGAQANSSKNKKLVHIVFNNFAHDSVGGQKPPSEKIAFYKVAKEMGYSFCYRVNNLKQIKNVIKKSLSNKKSTFIEIICNSGHRENLSRPDKSAVFYKSQFMKFLKNK